MLIFMLFDIGKASAYQITGQQITFEGVCPECAKKESIIRRPCVYSCRGFESKVERKYNVYNGASFINIKGIFSYGKGSHQIGGNTFQYFYAQSRGGSMRALDVDDMNSLSAYMKET